MREGRGKLGVWKRRREGWWWRRTRGRVPVRDADSSAPVRDEHGHRGERVCGRVEDAVDKTHRHDRDRHRVELSNVHLSNTLIATSTPHPLHLSTGEQDATIPNEG